MGGQRFHTPMKTGMATTGFNFREKSPYSRKHRINFRGLPVDDRQNMTTTYGNKFNKGAEYSDRCEVDMKFLEM